MLVAWKSILSVFKRATRLKTTFFHTDAIQEFVNIIYDNQENS